MHGSNMLLSVAKTFTMKIETILEEVNKFTSANTVDKKYISAESKQRRFRDNGRNMLRQLIQSLRKSQKWRENMLEKYKYVDKNTGIKK